MGTQPTTPSERLCVSHDPRLPRECARAGSPLSAPPGIGRASPSGKGHECLQAASPYEANPLDINPLRDALEELIDTSRMPSVTVS